MEQLTASERRVEDRFQCDATITWCLFHKDSYFSGWVVNFSHNGMSFETTRALTPGAIIFLRVKKRTPRDAVSQDDEWLKSFSLAQVKWCRDLAGDFDHRYEVGLRYHISV
jgi:hypothetical protein